VGGDTHVRTWHEVVEFSELDHGRTGLGPGVGASYRWRITYSPSPTEPDLNCRYPSAAARRTAQRPTYR
jgi:hypothetical protein